MKARTVGSGVRRENCGCLGRLWPLGIGVGVAIITAIPSVQWLFHAKLRSARVALEALYPFPVLFALSVDLNGREGWLFALVLSQFLVYGAIIALGRTRVIQVRFAFALMALHLIGASALVYHEYFR